MIGLHLRIIRLKIITRRIIPVLFDDSAGRTWSPAQTLEGF